MQLNQYIDTGGTDLDIGTSLNFPLQVIRSCVAEDMTITSQALKAFWL